MFLKCVKISWIYMFQVLASTLAFAILVIARNKVFAILTDPSPLPPTAPVFHKIKEGMYDRYDFHCFNSIYEYYKPPFLVLIIQPE